MDYVMDLGNSFAVTSKTNPCSSRIDEIELE